MKKDYNIILGSNSPRRRELLGGLELEFSVSVLPGIDESYPEDMPAADTAEYISIEKAAAYKDRLKADDLLITADTVVVSGNKVLGKPEDHDKAKEMLRLLSGKTHCVITGVCLTTKDRQKHFSVKTEVTFKVLSESEIEHYVSRYKPFDKAGAYGIQEWIGYIGVTSISGSYFNVMGLPVQRIYDELQKF